MSDLDKTRTLRRQRMACILAHLDCAENGLLKLLVSDDVFYGKWLVQMMYRKMAPLLTLAEATFGALPRPSKSEAEKRDAQGEEQ